MVLGIYHKYHFSNSLGCSRVIIIKDTCPLKIAKDHRLFINDEFEIYYNFERRLGNLFTYCSVLALLISCMGIFGLASFTAEQRTKEIGIRKVLGASIQGIIYLLSKEFVKWVLVANIIAWPLAYWVMTRWLENFAYRIDIGLWIFALSGILALLIALLTVSYQSIKSAVANPIDCLRYE